MRRPKLVEDIILVHPRVLKLLIISSFIRFMLRQPSCSFCRCWCGSAGSVGEVVVEVVEVVEGVDEDVDYKTYSTALLALTTSATNPGTTTSREPSCLDVGDCTSLSPSWACRGHPKVHSSKRFLHML